MAPNSSAGALSGAALKKRKEGNSNSNVRGDNFTQKRAKLHAARNIPAQSADAALKDGELDLVAFVAAHEFEIRALEQSMATSKAVGSSRAFQQVPRGLRRRTASHNPKRVPQRLRARAKREMDEDNTPLVESRKRKPRTTRARIRAQTARRLGLLAARKRRKKLDEAAKSNKDRDQDAAEEDGSKEKTQDDGVVGRAPRPKIRRNVLNEPPKPPAKFRKRQINKTWLPTHQWHAKRARMTEPKNPLWRFAIPTTPNEKIYRPTHRAQGERGALVWDMSYMSTIGIHGNSVGMARVLKRVGIWQESCWNDRGKKWRLGTRAWSGVISREKDGIRRSMCPATVVWDPEPSCVDESRDERKILRRVLLRVHPSAFLEVFKELLRLVKMETPQLYIEDLRFEIGSIELTGPASTETLLAVLTPHPADRHTKNQHAALFQSLKGLTNPASLPANAVLNFCAQDPRLKYPPRKMECSKDDKSHMDLMNTIAEWKAEQDLVPSALFDRDIRHKASCLPSQKSINRRRGKTAPGVFLKASSVDPPIPITLIACRCGSGIQAQGTWVLLAPWKCILPLWYSIVHCPLLSGGNPRFAGLDESMQVAFERGLPWFPADFVATDAGADWEADRRRKRRWDWTRRPKSKRLQWKSLDLGAGRKGEVGDGLACDFEYLFGLSQLVEDGDEKTDSTQEGNPEDSMDIDQENFAVVPKDTAQGPLKLLQAVSKATFNSLLSPSPRAQPPMPSNAVICVRISLLSRGVVGSCARIYRLPPNPPTIPKSSSAEVPATIPPQEEANSLPQDLRSQWLTRIPSPSSVSPPANMSLSNASSRRPAANLSSGEAGIDLETRKRLLARELLGPPSPYPAPPINQLDIGGYHPLVPDASNLVGFVTSGSFCLASGQGAAIGGLALEKVLADVRSNPREGRLCIVRNAGENVGWIARWEIV